MRKLIAATALMFMTVLMGCNRKTSRDKKEETITHRIVLTEKQFSESKLHLSSLTERRVRDLVLANGILELPPQNKASVSSYVQGIIKNINVIPGQFVKKGSLLATIEHPDIITLQENYIKSVASREFLRKELDRDKVLSSEQVIATKKLQQIQSEYTSQEASVEALEKQIDLIGLSPSRILNGNISKSIPVYSPIAGYINIIHVNIGSFVEPAREIFRIIDNHHIHLDLHVFEKDVVKIKEGQKVFFKLTNGPDDEMTATIFAVGKAIDESTKAVGVHADIEGDKKYQLMPGMFVQAKIISGERKTLAVPDTSVITDGSTKFLFVLTGRGKSKEYLFEKLPVITGVTDDGWTEITSNNLKPEMAIVSQGSYYLLAHSKVDELEQE